MIAEIINNINKTAILWFCLLQFRLSLLLYTRKNFWLHLVDIFHGESDYVHGFLLHCFILNHLILQKNCFRLIHWQLFRHPLMFNLYRLVLWKVLNRGRPFYLWNFYCQQLSFSDLCGEESTLKEALFYQSFWYYYNDDLINFYLKTICPYLT